MRRTLLFLPFLVASTGCYSGSIARALTPDGPDGDAGPKPVAEVLSTAVGASHVATLALAALQDGASVTCAELAGGAECTTIGCPFTVNVSYDLGECESPIASDGDSGFTVVTGVRTENGAVLDAAFAGLELGANGSQSWFVARIAGLVAETDGYHVAVGYAQQSVEIRTGYASASAELEQHVWGADVDLQGTPGDTSDDVYVIGGGLQDVEASGGMATVMQATIHDATVTPECRRNPTWGRSTVQEVGAGSSIVISLLSLGFHDECDGRADVTSAIGTNMFSLGGTVSMDLQD